jgi:hypothetical protein
MVFFGVLCVVAVQPVFAQTSATTSNSTGWTAANWIALVAAISSAIVAIIGALKGIQAQKTADSNTGLLMDHAKQIASASGAAASAQSTADSNAARLNVVANHLDSHGQQITSLAQNQVPASLWSSMMQAGPKEPG